MRKSIYTNQYQVLLLLIRDARAQTGLTQTQMAARLGMSQSDVSKCEQGLRRLDVIELKSWVEALGTTLPDFVRRFEDRLAMEPYLLADEGADSSV